MERQEIMNKVIELVADHFELDPKQVLGAKSLLRLHRRHALRLHTHPQPHLQQAHQR